MSTIIFDTLDFTRKLRDAGFDEKQAEAVVRIMSDAQSALVTREHFDLETKFTREHFSAELTHTRWMLGILIALAVANFAKQFF